MKVEQYITKVTTRVGGQVRYKVQVPRSDGTRPASFHSSLGMARAEKRRIIEAIEEQLDPDMSAVPFREVADLFMRTRDRHKGGAMLSNLNNHVVPRWGAIAVGDITTPMLVTWLEELSRTRRLHGSGTLAPGTVHRIYDAFRGVMSFAVERGYRTTSPCPPGTRISTMPKARDGRFAKVPVDPAVVARIYRELPPELRTAALVAATTMIRTGELRALRATDIDTENMVLHVNRQMIRGSMYERPTYRECKADSGGAIEMTHALLDALTRHYADHYVPNDEQLLFTNRGRPLHRDAILREWKRARERAGVTKGYERFHDLRHHGVSTLLAAGVQLPDIQAAARHRSPRTTLLYSHQVTTGAGVVRAAMEELASQLGGSTPAASGS